MILMLYAKFQDLMNREEGQDLIEYALLAALIALAATVAVKSVGTELTTAFDAIETTLTASL
ncbi:MAG: Flp family type IVb pilin [Terracidiphilus sp.]